MNKKPTCPLCGLPFENEPNPIFEGYHALCFHLVYEHRRDADVSCGVYCFHWRNAMLRQALEARGIQPEEILRAAFDKEWDSK